MSKAIRLGMWILTELKLSKLQWPFAKPIRAFVSIGGDLRSNPRFQTPLVERQCVEIPNLLNGEVYV
jgi:hypothetical protein